MPPGATRAELIGVALGRLRPYVGELYPDTIEELRDAWARHPASSPWPWRSPIGAGGPWKPAKRANADAARSAFTVTPEEREAIAKHVELCRAVFSGERLFG